jgi:hypothetical protein
MILQTCNQIFWSANVTLNAASPVTLNFERVLCDGGPIEHKYREGVSTRSGRVRHLEEIKNKTREAAVYLVQSLEAGHSEV